MADRTTAEDLVAVSALPIDVPGAAALALLAVDGPLNGQKSDGDAATWLPPNQAYRCAYVAR